jgi:hypothetical protein
MDETRSLLVMVRLYCEPLTIRQTGVRVTKQDVCYKPLFLPHYSIDFVRSAVEVRSLKRQLYQCLLSSWPLEVLGTAPPHAYRPERVQFQLHYLTGTRYAYWCPLSPLPGWMKRRDLSLPFVSLDNHPRPSIVVVARVQAGLRPIHCRRPVFHDFLDGLLEKRRCRRSSSSRHSKLHRVLRCWTTLKKKWQRLGLGWRRG